MPRLTRIFQVLLLVALASSAGAPRAGILSRTGPVIAIMGDELFVGQAEGNYGGAGTLTIHAQQNPAVTCAGEFTSSAKLGGKGQLRCSDGAGATFRFDRLTIMRGHGSGTFTRGPMSFTYGLSVEESRPYLKLPAGKRLAHNGTTLELLALAGATWPQQSIKVLMPFPPGGTVDVVTRLACTEAGAILGKPFVLDYKPGAAGIIASEAGSRAAPDGYTILIVTPNHTINPALRKKLPYDTERDFVPVSLIAAVPELLVAHPSVPFDDMQGFIRYAKANPGKLNYSSAGIGTLPHITMEVLLRAADVKVAHVAYKGAAPALTDLLAGVVQLKYDTYSTSAQLLAAGKLKVLATAGRKRLPNLPGVPTVAESGFPGYEGYLWIGALAPRGTPPEVVRALSAAFASAMQVPAVVERLRTDGAEVGGSTPEEFGKLIASELKLWAKVIAEAGITAQD